MTKNIQKFISKVAFRLALITLSTYLTLTNYSQAAVITRVKYENYQVVGKDISEISQDLQKNGPKDEHGEAFAAKTKAKFTWKYIFATKADTCSIRDILVEVELTYKLPELEANQKLDAKQHSEWLRYQNATLGHENGHADISINTAKQIEAIAMSLQPKADCGELSRTANILIQNILHNHDRLNVAYDDSTLHGVTQGAAFFAENTGVQERNPG